MTTWNLIEPHQTGPVAVGEEGERSAADLLRAAASIAQTLPNIDAGGVAVVCADRYHFACAVLGVWLAGHRVSLAPNGRTETVNELRKQFGWLAVLGDGQESADMDVRTLSGSTQALPPRPSFQGEQLAAYVYTSGSTGESAVYGKTFDQLLGEALLLAEFLGMQGTCVLPTVPSHHIYGLLAGVLAPLVAGACFVRETPLHAAQIVSAVDRYKANVLVASPAHLKGFSLWATQAPKAELPTSLRRIISSGAPLPEQTAKSLSESMGFEVLELFGSTETGGIAYRMGNEDRSWKPLAGVKVSTAKQLGRSSHCDDQMLVSSPFTGHQGWFATGDIIQLVDESAFIHLGRVDGVVKVGGRRVDLGALERCLAQVPGVEDLAIVALQAAPPRDVELACVLAARGVCVEDLRAALLRVFDPVAVPRRWRFVETLPRQENGKLPRATLADVFADKIVDPLIRLECEARGCHPGAVPGQYLVSIYVPKDAWFFKGHFEGDPLMPGVVQVNDLVLVQTQRFFPDLRSLRQTTRLKFRRPIRPGELLTLQMTLGDDRKSVRFELYVGEDECSSGVLHFSGDGT